MPWALIYSTLYIKHQLHIIINYTTYPSSQNPHPILPLRLHRRLDGIHGRQHHPECRRRQARKHRLDERREALHVQVSLEEREDSYVRGGVAEARDGALDECGGETLVVARPAAVVVECPDCGGRAGAVPILVVHDRTKGLHRFI